MHVGDEQRDVGASLTQWRYDEREHRESVIEILTKADDSTSSAEVAVGRRDDANVHTDRARRADARHLALLENAEQPLLYTGAHLADFVEKDRSAVRRLEHARAVAHRAGERALHVSEQLALEHTFA